MDRTEHTENYLRTLNPATARQYRVALDHFHRWHTGAYGEEPDPALLTDEEAREWRGYLSGVQKLAAATVNVRLSALKGLALFCGRRIETCGVRQVQPPVEPLSGRDLGRLLAVVEGEGWMDKRNAALVSLLSRAGLRVGEATGLDLGDVEINGRSGRALVRRGKGLQERQVPLSLEARKALSDYLAVRPPLDTEALFLSKSGRRMSSQAAQRMVKGAAQQAVQALLDDPVIDRLPTVGRLLKLRHKFGDARLEAACQRALYFGDPAYKTVKRILTLGLEKESLPVVVALPDASIFVRSAEELVGDLVGGEGWN